MSGLELFDLICYLAGFVLFLLAALGVVVRKINLVAMGLAAWILVPLVHLIVSA